MEKLEILKDLAAVFRWTAKLNMHEAIANHFSVCAPGSSEDFYVNGCGMHFSTIKASDLLLIEQSKMEEIKNKPEFVDPTALHIHGSIHKKVHTQNVYFMFFLNMQQLFQLWMILLYLQ